MRFPISAVLRTRVRFYQPVDIYNHNYNHPNQDPPSPTNHVLVPSGQRTIEHVVPARVLARSRTMQHDPMHLYMTSAALNRFRGDYRFGGEESQAREERWEPQDGSYRDARSRVFYPRNGHRLVAHVLWKMMDKYPDLRDHEAQCIESPETWTRWLHKAWTPLERHILENNERLWNNYQQ